MGYCQAFDTFWFWPYDLPYFQSYIKHLTGTFHVAVVRNNGKEMYKNCAARAKFLFFCQLDGIDFFAVLVVVAI